MPEHAEKLASLIKESSLGNSNAFAELIDFIEAPLRSLIRFHVPREEELSVFSEALLRIWHALPNYKEKGQFLAYCKTISLRACYDYWRTNYKTNELKEADLLKASTTFNDWLSLKDKEAWLEGERLKELRVVLDEALANLCAEDRMVLQMVYFEDRPASEAAEVLEISWANVKVRLFRARKRLKKQLISLGVNYDR